MPEHTILTVTNVANALMALMTLFATALTTWQAIQRKKEGKPILGVAPSAKPHEVAAQVEAVAKVANEALKAAQKAMEPTVLVDPETRKPY